MKTPATLEREIEALDHEINALRREQSDLERQLQRFQEDEETDLEKRDLRAAALEVLEVAEYQLGGGDLHALTLAISKTDLTQDQRHRVKLLAREFLFKTL